ncbi:MAG: glycerate kinase [Tumebacillaceae bacterium]
MKIVLAPDSFKGSLSARDICTAMRRGIKTACPSSEIVEIPLADGGEGTVDNLVHATRGTLIPVEVTGPLGTPVQAHYGVLGDRQTAVIEMAQASGLTLIPPAQRNPLHATTYGTGELIRHALDAGYRRLIIGLGGSATNDGGAGMLRALGLSFLDEKGNVLPDGGAALAHLASLDDSRLDPRLQESAILIASDVTNPLCGPAGASAVFGPQKGATPAMVAELDHALNRFAEVVLQHKGLDIRTLPGGGAAGGTGAALLGFANATLRPGIEIVMEATRLHEHLQGADLVLTGEGSLDTQTLSGKVIAGVTRSAARTNGGVPVVALCGKATLAADQQNDLGLLAAFSIVPGPCSLEEAVANAARWTEERTYQIIRLFHN